MEAISDWFYNQIKIICPNCGKQFKINKNIYIKDKTYCSMNCLLHSVNNDNKTQN